MIIFSSTRLEQAIFAGDLSEREKIKYIMLPAIMMCLSGMPYICGPRYAEQRPLLNLLVSINCVIASMFVTYFGIIKCWRTNESLGNLAFFERFIILSVPVSAKLLVTFLPVSIISLLFVHHMKEYYPFLHKRFPIVLSMSGPIVTSIYYAMIVRSFARFGCLIQNKDLNKS